MSQKANLAGSGMSSDVYARHYQGVPDHRIVLAREGVNTNCVDCWETPLTGGLRCLPCFLKVAQPKARQTRAKCGTDGGYQRHKRQKEKVCDACRFAHNRSDAGRKVAA